MIGDTRMHTRVEPRPRTHTYTCEADLLGKSFGKWCNCGGGGGNAGGVIIVTIAKALHGNCKANDYRLPHRPSATGNKRLATLRPTQELDGFEFVDTPQPTELEPGGKVHIPLVHCRLCEWRQEALEILAALPGNTR